SAAPLVETRPLTLHDALPISGGVADAIRSRGHRSGGQRAAPDTRWQGHQDARLHGADFHAGWPGAVWAQRFRHRSTGGRAVYVQDRKSTRLNSSHVKISYAVY